MTKMMRGLNWVKKTGEGATNGHKNYDLIIQEYEKPTFDAAKMKDKILVKVKSAAMNPVDCKILSSIGADFPRVGRDFSGIIEEVGEDVKDLKPGDAVWGATCPAMQEYKIASSEQVSKKPSNLPFDEAAGIGVAYMTSYDALFSQTLKKNRPPIDKDTKVLIIGASGGTGLAGCQLAKNCASAKLVVGVCSGKNEKYVCQNGADAVMDYRKVDFEGLTKAPKTEVLDEVRKHLEQLPDTVLTKSEKDNFGGFDLVYDCVSSAEDFNYRPISHKMLNSNGHYVCINSASSTFWLRAICANVLPGFMTNVLLPGNEELFLTNLTRKKCDRVSQWFSEGKLKVNIFSRYAFNENLKNYNSIYEDQMSRRANGKVILTGI